LLVLAASALTAACLLALFVRRRRYRGALRGSAHRDDVFPTRLPPATFEVVPGPAGFELPPGVKTDGQTVFLHLSVASTLLGRLFDPFIAVALRNTVGNPVEFRATSDVAPAPPEVGTWHFQSFERGARGMRYLNLSPLFARRVAGPEEIRGRIELRGRFLRWSARGALLLFPRVPAEVEEGTCLVLAPHPDDAEIATFGMYARRPRRAWVVTVTAGERGSAALSPLIATDARARWLGDVRVHDSLSIPPGLAGVPPAHCANLVYPDGRLEEMWRAPDQAFALACEAEMPRAVLRARNPSTLLAGPGPAGRVSAGCTWNGLVAELGRLLESVKPGVVLCPHPLIDSHADHVFTAVALDAALHGLGLATPRPAIWLYAVHLRELPLHPFGPPEALASLPPGEPSSSRSSPSSGSLADAIVSLPLSPDLRRAKYLAIEAAHDLRHQEALAPRTLGQLLRLVKREISSYLASLPPNPQSFLRRAPRPNEIYYLVSPDSLADLVERALAARPASQKPTAVPRPG
jgi:LmbE family N-acetylglucosaminyl deacetylase